MNRGSVWTTALADAPATARIPSVLSAPATAAGRAAEILTVVPDPAGRFHRARHGEVGLAEGLALAEAVQAIVDADRSRPRAERRAVIAVVDLPSQAYGRLEETAGLHQYLAAAVDAYAGARAAGHPVVALVVGTALSGGFLAHGLQADRILVLDAPGVEIHAMHKPAAARITRRSVAELDELADRVPPLSYDVHTWMTLGIGDGLVPVTRPDDPGAADVAAVRAALDAAVADARRSPGGLSRRLDTPEARRTRTASRRVRDLLTAQWDGPR